MEIKEAKSPAQLQAFAVAPLTVLTVILGAVGSSLGDGGGLDRHGSLGLVILCMAWIQLGVGFSAHAEQLTKSPPKEQFPQHQPPDQAERSFLDYIHIFLGITLLTLSGLQVTWGLYGEYTAKPIEPWILVIHWL